MISGSPVDMGGCVNIVRLHVSDVVTLDSHPLPNTMISNYAYLVSTASGCCCSTGLSPPHDELDAIYRPTRYDLPRLLSHQGVSMRDVVVVVNCHLHFDHCGGNHLFPHARIVVQRTELEEAQTPGYTVREWVDFEGASMDFVDGEHDIWSAARVVPTRGHTMGHQSLVLLTPEGPVILAGQAAESAAGFDEGTGGWGPDRQELGATSIARLKAVSPTRVLFAHDECEWRVDAQGSQ